MSGFRTLLPALLLLALPVSAMAQDAASLVTPRGVLTDKKTSIDGATLEQIDQALNVTFDCKKSSFSSKYYDCDCMGMKFLEFRVNEFASSSDFSLLMKAQRACPNATDVAGATYLQCTTWAPVSRPYDYKEFCTCFASEVAKQFEKNTSLNEYVREDQMTQAHITCDGGRKFKERIDKQNFIARMKETGLYQLLFPGGGEDK